MKKQFSQTKESLNSIKKIGVNVIYPFVFLGILIVACKKEDKLGLELQSGGDILRLDSIISVDLKTEIFVPDTISTHGKTFGLLGSYRDAVFGGVKSDFYTQFGLSKEPTLFGDPSIIKVDSAFITLRVDRIYGRRLDGSEKPDLQTFRAYELTQAIDTSRKYNYTDQLPYNKLKPIAEAVDLSIPLDSVIGPSGKKELAQVVMKVDSTWITEIMTSGDDNFVSSERFKEKMRGVVVRSETPGQGDNEGNILSVLPQSDLSRLIVYYRTDKDTLSYPFEIGSTAGRFENYIHDRVGTPVESALNNPTLANQTFYLQTMGGIRTKIKVPDFSEQLKKFGKIVVNSAQLSIPVFDTSDVIPNPNSLGILAYTEEEGKFKVLPDGTIKNLDGKYNKSLQSYVFNISRQIQEVINKSENTNFDLLLLIPTTTTTSARVVLNGNGSMEQRKLNLKIYFTPIQ